MKKIILDCDPGIDDLVAIALLKVLDVEVLGLTTVCGNQTIDKCTRNALSILESWNLNIPVYEGAKQPMFRKFIGASEIHGDTGLCSVCLKDSTYKVKEIPAHTFIYQKALELKGELEIVAIGPLTNLGIALTLYPNLKNLIKKITIMGGGHKYGNVTPAAEFNIYADPDAAKLVFDSGIHVDMVGLDVTMSQGLDMAEISQLESLVTTELGTQLVQALKDIYNIGTKFGLEYAYLHDPIALLHAIIPDFTTSHDYRIDIETKGKYTLGKTVVDVDNTRKMEPNASLVTDFKKEILIEYLKKLIV